MGFYPFSQALATNTTPVAVVASGDTSGATDFTNITAALATGKPVFLATGIGAGTYWTNQIIQLPGYTTLTGAGAGAEGSIIKMAAGANLAAVAASSGWSASTNSFSVNPAYIRGIIFDGNTSGQTSGAGHCLVLQTYASYIEDCVFQNGRGDGLRFDYYGANGSSGITGNTAVENRVFFCQSRAAGAVGIHVNDPTFSTFTDGFILDCIIANAALQGVSVDSAAGWKIEGNHAYGNGMSAIACARPLMTRVANNYCEDWGASATSGSYAAIDFSQSFINDAIQGSAITGNTMRLNDPPGNAATLMYGIAAEAATGDIGTVSITGNVITAPDNTHPANYTGVLLACQSSTATLNVMMGSNQFTGNWGAGNVVQVPNSGTINLNEVDSAGALISNGNQPAATIQTSANQAFTTALNVLAPQLSAVTRDVLFNLGVSTTTRNAASWSFEYIGVGSTANLMKFNFFGTSVFFTITAAGIVTTLNNTLDDSAGNAIFAGNVKLPVGTATLAPLTFQSGTNLTSATAGDVEYDGASTYMTNETTSGRGLVSVEQKFRLTATGGNISTIANYFGTTSNISLVSGAEYEIEIVAWFLKTTSGTVTWTFTNSAAPTSMTIDYQLSPATGIVTTAAATDLFGQQYNVTATAPTVVSGALTSGVNHRHKFFIRLINGTGTSLQIQATAGAGTITPGINSYWIARRVPAANVGHFAA